MGSSSLYWPAFDFVFRSSSRATQRWPKGNLSSRRLATPLNACCRKLDRREASWVFKPTYKPLQENRLKRGSEIERPKRARRMWNVLMMVAAIVVANNQMCASRPILSTFSPSCSSQISHLFCHWDWCAPRRWRATNQFTISRVSHHLLERDFYTFTLFRPLDVSRQININIMNTHLTTTATLKAPSSHVGRRFWVSSFAKTRSSA